MVFVTYEGEDGGGAFGTLGELLGPYLESFSALQGHTTIPEL